MKYLIINLYIILLFSQNVLLSQGKYSIEKIDDGFLFTEGPVWIGGTDGYLLFSDIDANKVYKWSLTTGSEVFIDNSGYANGLALNSLGELFLAQHSGQIGRYNNGTISTVISTFNGKRLNSVLHQRKKDK